MPLRGFVLDIKDSGVPAGSGGRGGQVGPQGPPGAPGADGKSAYEIAVSNGFIGSESQWLESLKGKDGVDGAPGKDGAKGADGTNGADGSNGLDGLSAYEIAITEGFEGTEAEWLLSLKGEKGEPGVDGVDGAQGPAGVDGAPGAKGDPGASFYEQLVAAGYTGTEEEFTAALLALLQP